MGFTKEVIKPGMFVTLDDGTLRIVIGDTLVSVSKNKEGGGIPISWFDENFMYDGIKIMEVHEPTNYEFCSEFDFWTNDDKIISDEKYSTLIWKRPDFKDGDLVIGWDDLSKGFVAGPWSEKYEGIVYGETVYKFETYAKAPLSGGLVQGKSNE